MKRRLDDELVAQGICSNRADALRLLMAGKVSSGGERLTSPGMKVVAGIPLHIKGALPYVGRGGLKLAGALDIFNVDPTGLCCLDVGCSTGGFTDCLLKRGAQSVIAVDVGRAQFAWELRCDTRVKLLERTNACELSQLGYVECCDLAVCDVSFTSIKTILPAVIAALVDGGRFLALVKPQFEAPASSVGDGGIVRDPHVWAEVLKDIIEAFVRSGLYPSDFCPSPVLGAKGNREFFLLGHLVGEEYDDAVLAQQLEQLFQKTELL